jgi:hypothetical protein
MDKDSTTVSHAEDLFAGDAWFDPIEAGIRDRIRGFIEVMLEEELAAVLGGGATSAVTAKAIAMASVRVICLAHSGRRRSACRGRG